MTLSRSARLAALTILAAGLGTLALVLGPPARSAPATTDLFLSEYVEGSGNTKALELYNGTGAPVTLTGTYSIQLFSNGGATPSSEIPLTGTVADGDVFVLARSTAAAAVLAQADQTTTNFLYNGNDAVALVKAGTVIDVIGQIGADPGVEWGAGDASTADNTLRRKATVTAGDPVGSDAFDPAAQWDGYPIDTFDGLGAHPIGVSNSTPDAVDDSASAVEDGGAVTIDVLANDSDADGDALAVTGAGPASGGTVTVAANSLSVRYEPPANFNGAASFNYTVGDGNGASDSATVLVTVAAVNDPPVAADDVASTAAATPVAVAVLANDLDADGDVLRVGSAQAATGGSVAVAADGLSVTFSPAPGFSGLGSFSYTATDGNGGTDTAAVSVEVGAGAPEPLAPCAAEPTIVGTRRSEILLGTPGDDVIHAGKGHDLILGLGGDDAVCAGRGNDFVLTGGGDDTIDGGPGKDLCLSFAGHDDLTGCEGRWPFAHDDD